MVARCERTGELGACVCTTLPAVGSVVPHVERGVGAIATQAATNVTYGTGGLQRLKIGLSPETALNALLVEDEKREVRQVGMIGIHGRTAVHTGSETVDWKGHQVGTDHVIDGNMLAEPQVIQAMADSFKSSNGPLENRLMAILEAGQTAGGDKRGRVSVALIVRKTNTEGKSHPYIDLRVDERDDPVRELRRIFDDFKSRYFPCSQVIFPFPRYLSTPTLLQALEFHSRCTAC